MEELKQQIDILNEEIKSYKNLYRNGDKYEQARAERKLMKLMPKREQLRHVLAQLKRKEQRRYKMDNKCRKWTGYSTKELSKQSLEYYGQKPSKVINSMAKGVLATLGTGLVLYGTVWGLYQLHNQGINNSKDLVNAVESYQENNQKQNNKLNEFFKTKEGKYIEKYSLIYQIDKNLAASVYLNTNGIASDTYITAYNSVTNKNDEIITTKHETVEQAKAICAFLAETSKICKGNPIAMLALLEQGYETMTINIHQTGLNIEDYKVTQQSEIFNTEFVQTILKQCPNILANSWVEDGILYTKTINMSTGEEYIEQDSLEQSNNYHR